MTALEVKVLPCPFCGGEAFLRSPTLPMMADCDDVQVSCCDCDTNGPAILFDQDVHGETDLPDLEAEAIAAWNTRATQADALAVVQSWQGIESAPRDGTPFIAKAYVSSTKTGAEWEENHVIWCHDETGEIHSDCEQGWGVDDYSLWMPLPASPLRGEGEA
jgi:Lar family restriction alleviation protein